MSHERKKGFDPGRSDKSKKKSHDTGGAFVNKDGEVEMKKRKMPCGVEVDDTEGAEYEHRVNCNNCKTLW